MSRVIVTGINGFIGSHLAEELIEKGYDVYGIVKYVVGRDLKPIEKLLNDIVLLTADITDYNSVSKILKEVMPDYVIHLAALSPVRFSFELPFEFQQANYIGSLNIAHAMLNLPDVDSRRLLIASTAEVYGIQPENKPFTEDLPLKPSSPYSVSKAAMDMYIRMMINSFNLNATILRCTNSILGDQNVVFFNDVNLHIEPIEQFNSKVSNVFIPAFDTNYKMNLFPLKDFIKHKYEGDAFEIKTRYGREIKVTGDHSIFKWTPKWKTNRKKSYWSSIELKKGKLEAVPVRELKINDHIAVPTFLPCIPKDKTIVKISDYLIENEPDNLWNYLIISPKLKETIKRKRKEISKIVRDSNLFKSYDENIRSILQRYVKRSSLPLSIILQLNIDIPDDAKIACRYSHQYVSNIIETDEDFLWFLGLYVAEGFISISKKDWVIGLASNEKFLIKCKNILHRYGIKGNIHKQSQGPTIIFHSKLLCYVLNKILGFSTSYSKNKQDKLPRWIIQLPLNKLKFFLEGYKDGDGTHSGKWVNNTLSFSTTNKMLANDILIILLRFGLFGILRERFTTFKKRYGDKKFKSFNIVLSKLDNFNIIEWDKGVKQKINAKRVGDLVLVKIKEINRCEPTEFVYDFSVEKAENFIAGNGVCCHNTYGRKFSKGFIVEYLVTEMLKGNTVYIGAPNSIRDYMYVTDHTSAYITAMDEKARGEVFNAATGIGISNKDLAFMIAEKIGFDKNKIVLGSYPPGYPYRPLASDQPYLVLDASKIKSKLGWKPAVSLNDGLKKVIDFWKDKV